jgi:hypothetical protein
MKDELGSESQAETWKGRPARRSRCGEGGKIRESLFFCPTYLSAILPLAANRASQSNPIKVNQSDFVGQAGGQNWMEVHHYE